LIKKADQTLNRLIGATGYRRTNSNILTGTQTRQQRRQSRLQQHEQRSLLGLGQLQQISMQLGGQVNRQRTAAIGTDQRPGAVGRQVQLIGNAAQSLLPERQLLRHRTRRIVHRAQGLALPERIIGVLDRQVRPLRGSLQTAGGISRR